MAVLLGVHLLAAVTCAALGRREVVAAVALLSGGVLAVLAGLGLVRLPDVGARLQAATKPQVLGLV